MKKQPAAHRRLAELGQWASAPPRRSAAEARRRLLSAVADSSEPRHSWSWPLLATAVLATALLVAILGLWPSRDTRAVGSSDGPPVVSLLPTAPPLVPAPRRVIEHTLTSGTHLYFTLSNP